MKAIRQLFSKTKVFAKQSSKPLAALVIFGCIGSWLLHASHATTQNHSQEAESGTSSGQLSVTSDTSASNGQSVRFGLDSLPDDMPTNLQAFTGGNTIALVWNMPASAHESIPSNNQYQPIATTVRDVKVFRNNSQVATITPNNGKLENQELGNQYIDTSVKPNTTYQYKIQVDFLNGVKSGFTTPVTVTQPFPSAPVPTVLIDDSATPQFDDFMQTYIKPEVLTWYPKVAAAIAYPTYTPPTTIKLFIDPQTTTISPGAACVGAFYESPPTVHCDPTWFTNSVNSGSAGLAATFVHETTHLMQSFLHDSTGWATEGGASWASDFYARQHINHYTPHIHDALSGYSIGAFFIDYIRYHYDAQFPRKLNIAQHNGTYTTSTFTASTGGKTQDQVWAEAVALYNGRTGTVKNGTSATNCVDLPNNSIVSGTQLQSTTCSGTPQQTWLLNYRDPTKKTAASGATFDINLSEGTVSDCLDVRSSGTADGTVVQLWNCNYSDAQAWRYGANGSLVNVNSGKCLAPQGNSTAASTPLTIQTCNGSDAQRWTVPT